MFVSCTCKAPNFHASLSCAPNFRLSCIHPPPSLSIYRLMDLYMVMHHKLHSSSTPLKILYHIGNKEALLGWVSNLMLDIER